MAKKKTGLKIPWPFAHQSVGLNSDTELLKLVAMITMLIDHVGKMFFPKYYIMRIIGRMAFPIYAYCIAAGCVFTRNHLKYITRLVALGLIAQPFYVVAMGHTNASMYTVSFSENPIGAVVNFYVNSWKKPSILLTLVLGVMVIWTIRQRKLVLTIALCLFIWQIQANIDYGWRGVALMVLMYLFINHWWISLPVVFTFMFWWGTQGIGYELFGVRFGTQMFALMALPLIYIPTYSKLKIDKWIFYFFYPAHFILIMMADKLMG